MDKIEVQCYKNVNINNLVINSPSTSIDKYTSICEYTINQSQKKKFYMKTPKLKLNSELQSFDDLFKFECLFSKTHPDFYNFFYDFEKYLIKKIIMNSKEWFNIKFDEIKVKNIFQSQIYPPESLSLVPKLVFEMPIVDGKIQCSIFDEYDKQITLDKLTKDKEVILILTLPDIVFKKDIFYANWIITQIKVFDNSVNEKEYMFIEDDDHFSDENIKNIYDIIDTEINDSLSDHAKCINMQICK